MLQQSRVRIGIGIVLLLILGAVVWAWSTSGKESTDDAQVDAHLTQMSARVSGTVTKVAVDDNQLVDAGALLVQLDPSDYQVAVDKARAELADAEASALAAQSSVPPSPRRRPPATSRRRAVALLRRKAAWPRRKKRSRRLARGS